MYKLTENMLTHLHKNLQTYHTLFKTRCIAANLKELVAKAIASDADTNHWIEWVKEKPHSSAADLSVRVEKHRYLLKIKAGQWKHKRSILTLSGYRLGQFAGNLKAITAYLNAQQNRFLTLSIPYEKWADKKPLRHVYQVCYIPNNVLMGLSETGWKKIKGGYQQQNAAGTTFSLTESMSWQIWWDIPEDKVRNTEQLVIETVE